MSYGITSEGFVAKELFAILAESLDRIQQLIERIDVRADSPLYMIVKMISEREASLWEVLEDVFGELSMTTADGEYLKMFGAEEDNPIGDQEFSTGTLYITGTANGTVIPVGSEFSTNEGVVFKTIEEVELARSIQMTRASGGDLDDPIPSPYSTVSLDFVSKFSDGTSVFDPSTYSFTSDTLTWITPPADGTSYYIWTANEITVEVSIIASVAGVTGNVPANTIVVNSSGISDITDVNNLSETSQGSEEEDVDGYRSRLMATRHRNWTLANVKSDVDSVSGVRASKVYQNEGIDQYNPTNWSAGHTIYTQTVNVNDSQEVGQTYSSGDRVLTLSAVTVRGRKVGTPEPLKAEVFYWKGTYIDTIASTLMTSGQFRSDDVDPNSPWTEQDIKIPLKFGGLDSSLTYLVRLTSMGSTSGYWNLLYENDDSYDYGTMYVNGTGLLGDVWFKTSYKGASFTSKIALERTYDWDVVSDNIETTIDDGGKKALAIQSIVSEATEVRINIRATIYIGEGYSFSTITGNIETSLRSYLDSLEIGDDVYWSRIHTIISSTEGVTRLYDLEVRRDSLSWTDGDITILDEEVAVLDDGTYGAGTSFTQGN